MSNISKMVTDTTLGH